MGDTTPKSNSNEDMTAAQARAFELGYQFDQALYKFDTPTMQVCLVNLINLRHNTSIRPDVAGQAPELIKFFAFGMSCAAMVRRINALLAVVSIQAYSDMAKFMPPSLFFAFGTGSTDACVDGRDGDVAAEG